MVWERMECCFLTLQPVVHVVTTVFKGLLLQNKYNQHL